MEAAHPHVIVLKGEKRNTQRRVVAVERRDTRTMRRRSQVVSVAARQNAEPAATAVFQPRVHIYWGTSGRNEKDSRGIVDVQSKL
jgi:hypothetical protein